MVLKMEKKKKKPVSKSRGIAWRELRNGTRCVCWLWLGTVLIWTLLLVLQDHDHLFIFISFGHLVCVEASNVSCPSGLCIPLLLSSSIKSTCWVVLLTLANSNASGIQWWRSWRKEVLIQRVWTPLGGKLVLWAPPGWKHCCMTWPCNLMREADLSCVCLRGQREQTYVANFCYLCVLHENRN